MHAPISKTPSECLKLTIQSFRLENKEFKEKVMHFQQEVPKSSLKVSENLGEDLASITGGAGKRDIPTFTKFFWEEQQKYIKCSSQRIRYHPVIMRFCLSFTAKSTSAHDDI